MRLVALASLGFLLLACGSSAASQGAEPAGSRGGTPACHPAGEPRFEVGLSLSPVIPTVAIVDWSIDEPVESATIDFGRDPALLEYRAPVDSSGERYRTLLLGMKPSTDYFVRVNVEGPCGARTSAIYSLTTGYLPNGVPPLSVGAAAASGLFAGGGFTINCTGLVAGSQITHEADPGTPTWAFIFDKDGDLVWAYELTTTAVAGCSRARLSVDGKFMWLGNLNNMNDEGALRRVSLDGLDSRDYATPARHHDFAFLPNGHLLYAEQANGGGMVDGNEGPDVIREMDPETEGVTDIYDEATDFADDIAASPGAHTNQVNYVPELGAISFSMRGTSTLGLVTYPGAELLAAFGGPSTTFDDMAWEAQHGHQVLAGRAWIFDNRGTSGGSEVLGFSFDVESASAQPILDYASGKSSLAFGDVKELPNGNLYVTYSTSGVFQEITPTGELLRELTMGATLGYSEHRASLYGPPPPFDAAP